MRIFMFVNRWLKKLFAKDDQPTSIKIQADQSNVNIFFVICKD